MPDKIIKIGLRTWRSLYAGPPASGKWVDDDLVIDAVGSIHICTTGGPNPVWSTIAGPAYTPPSSSPCKELDQIFDFAGNTLPIVTLPQQIPANAAVYCMNVICVEDLIGVDPNMWLEVRCGDFPVYANLDAHSPVIKNDKRTWNYPRAMPAGNFAGFFENYMPMTPAAKPINLNTMRFPDNNTPYTGGKVRVRVRYLELGDIPDYP